jgi:hypothetical protein
MPPTLTVEDTPNPHALKFVADRPIHPGPPRSYRQAPPPDADPLAAALFAAGPVTSVLIVGHFVTVNKTPAARWPRLRRKLEGVLVKHLNP